MARVLVIGHSAAYYRALRGGLHDGQHECWHAEAGRDGVDLVRTVRPAVVVLAWELPDGAGLAACKRILRAWSALVLFTAARASEEDRIRAFLAGAADFVVEPVSLREIVLRVQAILHRIDVGRWRPRIRVPGGVSIDPAARRVFRDGREIRLTRLEFALLLALGQADGHLVSREDLRLRAWGRGSDVSLRSIDTRVRYLRFKLGDAGARIESVRGAGYRWAIEASPDDVVRAARSG